jgi:hypothetical protein
MRLMIFLLSLLSPSLAAAGGKITLAECAAGGCRCALSGLDAQDMEALTDNAMPAAPEDYVVLYDQGKLYWSPLSLEELDRLAGGDGQCDLEVFYLPAPDNGQWQGKVRAQNIRGCPAQVEAMVPPLVAQMAYSGRVDWQGKFDPAKLVTAGAKQPVQWSERRPDLYKGSLIAPDGKGILQVSGDLTSVQMASDHISTTMQLRISGKNPALAALGMKDCRVTAVYDYRLNGK